MSWPTSDYVRFDERQEPLSLHLLLAFVRRLVRMVPGQVLDVALMKAARDVGATEREVAGFRGAIDAEKRSR